MVKSLPWLCQDCEKVLNVAEPVKPILARGTGEIITLSFTTYYYLVTTIIKGVHTTGYCISCKSSLHVLFFIMISN